MCYFIYQLISILLNLCFILICELYNFEMIGLITINRILKIYICYCPVS